MKRTMRKTMRRPIISVLLAVALVVIPVSGAFAATDTAEVTVTAVPSFVSISETNPSWTINGLDGNSAIEPSTTYYSNETGSTGDVTAPNDTVLGTDCYFQLTNDSTVITNIKVDFGDFTPGDTMPNVNQDGAGSATSATTTSFVAWSYYEGMTTYSSSKVLAKKADSDNLYDDLPAKATTPSLKWGLEIATRTDAWTSGDSMTSTVTITATSA